MSDGERQRSGNGEGDEGGTATMAHLGTRSTPPTNEMESPPVTGYPRSAGRACSGSARWLRPEAAVPSVGEMGSWLRPEAARRSPPSSVGEMGNETGQQRGVKGPPPIGGILTLGAVMFEITNSDAPQPSHKNNTYCHKNATVNRLLSTCIL